MIIVPISNKYLKSKDMDYVLWLLFHKVNDDNFDFKYKKEVENEILKKISKSSYRRNILKLKKLELIEESKKDNKKIYFIKRNFTEYIVLPEEKLAKLLLLNNTNLKVYFYLLKNKSIPKREEICRAIGLSPKNKSTISQYIKKLKALNLIEFEQNTNISI